MTKQTAKFAKHLATSFKNAAHSNSKYIQFN